MRVELANLSHCAVPFLRCAAVNLCWYLVSIPHPEGAQYIVYCVILNNAMI